MCESNSGRRAGCNPGDQGGTICRSFTGPQTAGLACRDGERWRVRGPFGAPEGQSGDYRMATGMDPSLAALIDATMAGDAFEAGDEREAMQRRWK